MTLAQTLKAEVKSNYRLAKTNLNSRVLHLTVKRRKRRTQTAWNKLLMPTVNVAAPFIGTAIGAGTKKSTGCSSNNTYLEINKRRQIVDIETYGGSWLTPKRYVNQLK